MTDTSHFREAIELVGRRWSGEIVRALLGRRAATDAVFALRFSEITAAIPGLSDRLAWERLKELERAGVVRRLPTSRREVYYHLTPKGLALRPFVGAVEKWAKAWVA